VISANAKTKPERFLASSYWQLSKREKFPIEKGKLNEAA
jgi:hypothetical protein